MEEPRSHKVLVVEDEGLIAHDIARRLEALGHEVLATVSTAQEAIEQAGAADLVLMDIHIDGDRDGVDAAMEIRAQHRVPVVFLTAHSDRSTLDRAKLAGPFGYVVKPLGAGSLHAAIEMATYKHRVERELEEREAWFSSTLESAADAVVTVDPAGRVRTLNRAAETMTGWRREQAEGKRLNSVVRFVDDRTGLDIGDPVGVALIRDATVTLAPDARLVSRSASAEGDSEASIETAVDGEAAPVKTSGDTLGVVLTLRDVGVRRWEERQMRQSQRLEAAGRLAASVASDYSHLLASIRNQAAHLLEQFSEYSVARRAAEEIHQAASAADHLTRRLSTFGARQTGERKVVSLNSVIRHLSKLIESVARGRAQVTLRLETGAGQVQVDPALLEQAIMNLVLHACATVAPPGAEAPPEPQRLSISTRRMSLAQRKHSTAFVALVIEYSVAEPDVEHLFDPAPSGEAGLALPVAHSIVQEHGGFLTARPAHLSESGPMGTRVEMLLPLTTEELPAASPEGSVPATLLLVDSREDVRAELHNLFEAAGFNLLEAADCDEGAALAALQEHPVNLVIADGGVADNVVDTVRSDHPGIEALRITDTPERSLYEIRRPFSGPALVERVKLILAGRTPGDELNARAHAGAEAPVAG